MNDIEQIRYRMRTQKNYATEHPIYCVMQKQRVFGFAEGYQDGYQWFDADSNEDCDQETSNQLDREAEYCDEWHIDGVNYRRVGFKDIDQFVTLCFTEQAARDFMESQAHRLNKPFLYVDSLDRNPEMIAVRKHLIGEP